MKVFIGWSGQRSQDLALALRDWLPLVLHYVEPWLSETDIAAGERWADAIAKELEASNFGVLCVTGENLTSPWILFEAGSLAKSLTSSRVIPLLLDLEFSEVSGPLAQFQAKKVDQEGLGETIQSINRAAKQPIQDAHATRLFEALWPDFYKKLEAMPAPKEPSKPMRTQHQILEELVASVRSLESKLREVLDVTANLKSPLSRQRGRRFHPMMFADMMGAKPGDPMVLLVFASYFRDEMPWLYELAVEAHRASRAGNSGEAREALENFRRACHFSVEGPFLGEFEGDRKMMRMFINEMEHMLPIIEEAAPPKQATKKRKKKV
jgi:hypothetical protein